LSQILRKARALLPEFVGRLTVRRESGPIATVDELAGFVSTRAAFTAQKTLYGYLKTRMGTRYPTMFEDDAFVASIDIAKLHVYAACLADLALFAVSRTGDRAGASGNRGCCERRAAVRPPRTGPARLVAATVANDPAQRAGLRPDAGASGCRRCCG